jgi:hypothetical protein
VVFGLAGLAAIAFIHRFAVDVIYGDQWKGVDLIRKLHLGTLTSGDLWAQHNENRILIPNLVVLAIGRTTHYQVLVEDDLSGLTLLVSSALVVLAHRRRSPGMSLIAYCPVVVVLQSYAVVGDALFGFNLSWFLVILALATAVFLADRVDLSRLTKAGALVAAVLGSYSSLQGLLVCPSVLVLLSRVTTGARDRGPDAKATTALAGAAGGRLQRRRQVVGIIFAGQLVLMGIQVVMAKGQATAGASGSHAQELEIANVTANIDSAPDGVVANTLGDYSVPCIRSMANAACGEHLSLCTTSLAADEQRAGLDPDLLTQMNRPYSGQHLSGTVVLDTSAWPSHVTAVQLVATGRATFYGYLTFWHTAKYPNGTYLLYCRAVVASGHRHESAPVVVTGATRGASPWKVALFCAASATSSRTPRSADTVHVATTARSSASAAAGAHRLERYPWAVGGGGGGRHPRIRVTSE